MHRHDCERWETGRPWQPLRIGGGAVGKAQADSTGLLPGSSFSPAGHQRSPQPMNVFHLVPFTIAGPSPTVHPIQSPQNRFCVLTVDPETLPAIATTLIDVLFYSHRCVCLVCIFTTILYTLAMSLCPFVPCQVSQGSWPMMSMCPSLMSRDGPDPEAGTIAVVLAKPPLSQALARLSAPGVLHLWHEQDSVCSSPFSPVLQVVRALDLATCPLPPVPASSLGSGGRW